MTRRDLIKYATDHPESRAVLVPLLRRGGQVPAMWRHKDPQDAFAELMAGCKGRLADLLKALKKFEKDFKRKPTSWAYPGTLGKVEEDLTDTLRFLRGH